MDIFNVSLFCHLKSLKFKCYVKADLTDIF